MKISLQAVLNFMTKGADKATKEVKTINKELDAAADDAERMNRALAKTKVGQNAMNRAGATQSNHGPGGTSSQSYRTSRSAANNRGAAARNFSGLVNTERDTGGFVAAYATLAANLFAVTAAFKALSDAAKVEQLTSGLELMGARSGVALKSVAQNLRDVTDNAISTSDAMRAVAVASSAGLSSVEIERLGKVARGTSLALGRDMGDSLDRLTRGAIKLEPELLDELGIMVRLDEATRAYAYQNNIAASSLTLTQKRQAFLNAVLEEGERKFGAINDQIEANPYDKLSASFRDMGTEILKVVNSVLKPIVQVLTEVPVLGLVIALGILNQTFSKVLPNLDSFNAKIASKQNINYQKLGNVFDQIPEAEAQLAIAAPHEKVRAQKELNNLRAQESRLIATITMQEKQTLALANYKQNVVLKGVVAASAELALAQANLVVDQARAKVKGQINILTAAGNILSAIGGGITMIAAGLASIFSIVTLIIGALGLLYAAWKYLNPPTEAQKQLKKYKEDMKELADSAAKTREQLANMTAGEGLDALSNSTLEIITNLENQYRLEKKIEEQKTGAVSTNRARVRAAMEVVNLREAEASIGSKQYKEDIAAKLAIAEADLKQLQVTEKTLTTYSAYSKEVQLAIEAAREVSLEASKRLDALIKAGAAEERLKIELIAVKSLIQQQVNTNKDLAASTDSISKGWNDLRLKELKTDLTDISKGFTDIDSRIQQISKSSVGLTARQKTTFLDSFEKIGIADIESLLNASYSLGVQINADDKAKIESFVENLKTIQQLEIKINSKDLNLFELAIAKTQLAFTKLTAREQAPDAAGILAKQAQGAEKRLQELKIEEKTAANTAKIATLALEIEKEQLKTSRSRRDNLKEIYSITIEQASKIKDIVKLSDSLVDYDIARREEIAKINELSSKTNLENSALNVKLSGATAGSNEAIYLTEQINSNNALMSLERSRSAQRLKALAEESVLTGEKIAAQMQAINLSNSEVSLLGNVSEKQEIIIAAEQLRLDKLKATNSFLKEQKQLLNEIASAKITNDRALAETNAAKKGGALDVASSRGFDIQALEQKKKEAADKKSFLETEIELAKQNAALKNKVFMVEIAAAKQNLINSIAQADFLSKQSGTQVDTSAAKNALNSIAIIEKDSEDNFTKIADREAALASLRIQLIDEEIKGIEIALDSIPRSAIEVGNRILENLKKSLGATNASIGLSGGAKDFFVSEREGILNNKTLSPEQKQQEIADLKEQSFAIQEQQTLVEGLTNIYDSLGTGIADAFGQVINGTKSAKQAFADLAISVLQSISKMIAEMIMLKIIKTALGGPLSFLSGAAGGTIPAHASPGSNARPGAAGGVIGLANGGVMSRAAGGLQGVVKQPTYLVGEGRYNEAVVPLPNGRAIPVQMHGGNSQSNNVQVNVNLSGNGSAQTETQGPDLNNLGAAIATAVQKELMAQKMPGGILNRYGAS